MCVGVDIGIRQVKTSLARFLQPLIDLRHSLPEGSTMDDLIVENVKRGVVDVSKSDVSLPVLCPRPVPTVTRQADNGVGTIGHSETMGQGGTGRRPRAGLRAWMAEGSLDRVDQGSRV